MDIVHRSTNLRRRSLPAAVTVWLCLAGASRGQEASDADQPAPATTTPSAAADSSMPAPAPVAELPIELRPYRVLVSMAIDHQPEFDRGFHADLNEGVSAGLNNRFGAMWNVSVEAGESAGAASLAALERRTNADLNAEFLPGEFDKVILVSVSKTGSRFDMAAREWDRNSQTAGHAIGDSTFDQRLCADRIAALIQRVFRPLAMIQNVDESGEHLELMLRAGEFLAADEDALPFRKGEFLTPYFRYLDRKREVRQIQPVPWTFLRVDAIERARLQCTVVSAFRSPVTGSRRRVELMGIAARPLFDESVLRIVPRDDPQNPMVGYRVDVMDRVPTAEDAVEDRLSLITDRAGEVRIPALESRSIVHVFVHSGHSVLAKVPLLPGLEPELELSTPDDTARLEVEGALALLEGNVIDIVARRAVLMARARGSAKNNQWDECDDYIRQLEELPDLESVEEQIRAIQLPALQTARALKNRVAEARIKKMCNDLQAIATQHLDMQKIKDFKTEMAELRAATR